MQYPPMKKVLLFLFLTSTGFSGLAQPKYERETRIKKTEVPEEMVSFIESINFSKKINWLKETGYHKTSYEVKTKHKGKKLSIEFSENGVFEDLEILIKTEHIPTDTYNAISEFLTNKYKKYSFEEIQIQYTGEQESILNYLRDFQSTKGLTTRYEIVISTKVDGSYTMFEYLFEDNGAFIHKSEIILKMTDNLEF